MAIDHPILHDLGGEGDLMTQICQDVLDLIWSEGALDGHGDD